MVFNSAFFFVSLVAIYGIYLLLHSSWRVTKIILIAYNFFFYGIWSTKFLAIMILTASVDYLSAFAMQRYPKRKKLLLTLSIISGIGLLAYFKYLNFAIEGANTISGLFGATLDWPTRNIILPIGISFYTFHSLSYTIDVYRGKLKPITDYSDYLLFVSFFPCLVAGPIIRATDFLSQIEKPRRPNGDDFLIGLSAVAFGLFLKSVVADNIGPYVNALFDHYQTNGVFENWLAATLFGTQIFADFAGYSGLAIGIARMFGFWIPRNFAAPYAAIGFSDFWRTWHISLSSWFRDYFYIPIGGNRVSPLRQGFNLVLTMFLCGLWHGATILFVIWGLLHGILLAIEHGVTTAFRFFPRAQPLGAAATETPMFAPSMIVAQIATYACVSAVWIAFRAKSIDQFTAMMKGLLWGPLKTGTVPSWLALIAVGTVICHMLQRRFDLTGSIERSRALCGLTIAVYFYLVVAIGAKGQDFIYFQF
jgi:alginate O-acetyltransferase complex protein AlgI